MGKEEGGVGKEEGKQGGGEGQPRAKPEPIN